MNEITSLEEEVDQIAAEEYQAPAAEIMSGSMSDLANIDAGVEDPSDEMSETELETLLKSTPKQSALSDDTEVIADLAEESATRNPEVKPRTASEIHCMNCFMLVDPTTVSDDACTQCGAPL